MRNSAAPGKTRYIGSVCTQPIASPMLRPHEGVGGVTPTARNDSAASAPIIDGIEIVA